MGADALIGNTIGGCMILEIIGQGGMGVIYKARQKSLDRIVALKVLAAHLANDANFVGRFQKEARAIARVNHPNILAVYDVGDDQNVNYMIMELIDGQSMAELQVERRGALPHEEAASFIKQAAQGLEAAQAAGIIHRDIKPENLMITKKNVVKVSDFGLAKEADSRNTSVDAVMGTPAFMSPEQCDGKNVDVRSDIYSLGGTFYRLITGRLPFEAETAMSMMYRHKHEALIPPHEVIPTLPQWISTVILKMMAKKREQRYQSMTEVIDAIDEGKKKPAGAAATPPPAAPAPSTAMPEYQPPPQGGPPPMGRLQVENTGMMPRLQDPASGIMSRGGTNVTGRLPVAGAPSGFAPMDSGSRLNIPSGIMGMSPGGLAVPDDGFTNVTRGDEMMGRGDRMGALKAYHQALQSRTLDNATRARLEGEIRKEVNTRRQAAETYVKKGMLLEASRECKIVVDLDSSDTNAKSLLKELDGKLAQKRTLVNDVRNAIAASAFEKAIKIWDSTPNELRDEPLGKQVEQLRSVVVPSLKLAEQGDSFSRQGRLEEAIATFDDALKINPACESARQGLKDAQTKVQRIDFLLKEGLQFSLEQNYEKAIETWAPILQLRPGHSQTVKNMVDSYVAQAQNFRAQGNIEAALAAYRGAAETDPQNRNVKRMLDEIGGMNDKLQVLEERADDARKRNRLGEAIGYWKEIQKLNPSSKTASEKIEELGKRRSGWLMKIVAVLIVGALIAVGGYQFVSEEKAIRAAQAEMEEQHYENAAAIIHEQKFLIYKKDAEAIRVEADLKNQILAAAKLEQEGKLDQAADAYEKLHALLMATDKRQALSMYEKCTVCRTTHLRKAAETAVVAKEWDRARSFYGEIATFLADKDAANEFVSANKIQADSANKLIEVVQKGIKEETNKNVRLAVVEYRTARNLVEKIKLPGVAEFVEAQLKLLGVDDKEYDKFMAEGKKALSEGKYAEARIAFGNAQSKSQTDKKAQHYLNYTKDVLFCNGLNMSLYTQSNPTTRKDVFKWEGDERGRAFCIDRYEYPNKSGDVPKSEVTWVQAQAFCKTNNKTLCRESDWTDACKGGEKLNWQYPYANAPQAGKCNTDGKEVMASGEKRECVTTLGVFDMSGNLAEWTDGQGENVSVMGGAFDDPASNTYCGNREDVQKTVSSKRIGFRCCRKLPQD